MGKLKGFKIPFTSLKDGSHKYKFEVTDSFFEVFPFSEIKKGNVQVNVTLVRHFHILTLDVVMEGEVEMNCDRCGNDYMQPVEGERKLVVHLNADHFEDEDDLISLPESVHELDLSQYLYEYISLLVPSKRVCGGDPEGTDQCDPEMIKKLEKLNPDKNRKGSDADKNKKPIDPRWDSLKNIKFDN
jgi:uncharacterized metal-binding protein YceD (DUF177 family)